MPVLCAEPNGRVGITPANEPFHLMPLTNATTAAVELTRQLAPAVWSR